MNAEKKAKKPPRPSSIYRKPIPEKKFRTKYLKLVEIPANRAFLEEAFTLKDGFLTLRMDLDRPSILKLNKLAKEIKSNRGLVKTGPIIAVIILVGGLTVFGFFFMNPILEGVAEGGLEAAFGARAEVASFRLQLLKFRVSMASIVVADRDKPMENLFETGKVELRLDPGALIRGKVYIEEASVASISVGTSRKISGALPDVPAKQTPPKLPKAEGPPLVDFENFDAEALLEREKSKLKVTAAYSDAAAAFDEATARWEGVVAETQRTAKNLQNDAKAFLAINPKSLKTPQAIAAAIEDAKKISDTTASTVAEVDAVASGVRADWESAQRLEKLAKTAMTEDYAHLKAYIDPKSGAAMEALAPSIREVLSDKVEKYIYYGQRALSVANAIKARTADKEKEAPAKISRKGRDVIYRSTNLPSFRLGALVSSFKVEDRNWSIELRDISSEPDLVDAPSRMKIAVAGAGQTIRANAVADLRTSSKRAFAVDASGEGLSVDLGDSLEQVGFGGFAGTATLAAEILGEKDGTVEAKSEIVIENASVRSPKGVLAKAVAEALISAKAVVLDVDYLKKTDTDPKIDIDTNIDDIVSATMSAMAERYAKNALAELEKALQDYVGSELAGKILNKEDLAALAAASLGDKKKMDALAASVVAKKKELENRGVALQEEAKRQAEEAARKAAAEADAAAKKAEDAAKKAAEDAAKKIKAPKIKL